MATTEKPLEFQPITYWLANPQKRLQVKVPGTRRYLKFNNGKVIVHTQQEADLVAATGEAFPDDGWRTNPAAEPNPVTGYFPGSTAAAVLHQKYIPQG